MSARSTETRGPAVGRLAHDLRALADTLDALAEAPDGEASERIDAALAPLAHAMLDVRRQVTAFFPEELFTDPARDLLLELFVAGTEGRALPTTAAYQAAAVPSGTAQRYIDALKRRGVVVGWPGDGSPLRLSCDAQARMGSYLQAAWQRLALGLGGQPALP